MNSRILREDFISPTRLSELKRGMKFQEKQSTPRFAAFNLADITDNSRDNIPPCKAFRVLEFTEDAVQPRRQVSQPSMVVYAPPTHPCKSRRNTCAGKNAQHQRTIGLNSTKASFFQSVGPQRGAGAPLSTDTCGDDSKFEDCWSNFEKQLQPEISLENEENMNIGWLPARQFCDFCKLETYTRPCLEMPTLSIWKLICCINDFVQCCTKPSMWEKYQYIVHRCEKCNREVGRVDPQFI